MKDKVKETMDSFPSAVAILSNSIGSSDDRGFSGAQEVERITCLPVIRHVHKKPQCIDEVRLSLTHTVFIATVVSR